MTAHVLGLVQALQSKVAGLNLPVDMSPTVNKCFIKKYIIHKSVPFYKDFKT